MLCCWQGHDTISSALSFTLFEIANHPEVQEKVVDEIGAVFGKDFSEPVDYEGIKRLHYLEQVVKEGLRLYPSVAAFQRQITEDEQIGKEVITLHNFQQITSEANKIHMLWKILRSHVSEQFETSLGCYLGCSSEMQNRHHDTLILVEHDVVV